MKRVKTDPFKVNVEFFTELTIGQVVKIIKELPNPQVIIWYIGIYGLKKNCAHFYRDFLINPVLEDRQKAKFWLVDLTAWGAFKFFHCSIHSYNCCCESIEKMMPKKIKCIKSSVIFERVQNISKKIVINY